ncbi:hypothetical protein LTS12_028828, partial [Elasticomyces elasticus]
DGALRHNNPVNIALWEGSRIWARDTQRDVVLSLGTGTGPEVVSPQKTPVRTTFRDGFIPRLCRSFITGLDGEMTWKHLLNHMEKDAEHRYFRLNVQLGDCEPRLDDITSMAKLSEDVISSKNDHQLTEIKFALLASSFFFELKRAPKFDASGFYICQGEIRIRGDHTKIFMALRQMSVGPIEFHKDGVPLGRVEHSNDVPEEGLFLRPSPERVNYDFHNNGRLAPSYQRLPADYLMVLAATVPQPSILFREIGLKSIEPDMSMPPTRRSTECRFSETQAKQNLLTNKSDEEDKDSIFNLMD